MGDWCCWVPGSWFVERDEFARSWRSSEAIPRQCGERARLWIEYDQSDYKAERELDLTGALVGFFCLFGGPISNRLGLNWTLLLGAVGYPIYS